MIAKQWRTVDITVHTDKEYNNPFMDVDVYGEFTSESGTTLKLLGFWDGEGNWIVRFAPTELGKWNYVITSTDDNADFSVTGEVECLPYDGDLAIYKHGFIKVSEDKTFLCHADDTPFFWLGDTHWTFATEDPFDYSNAPEEAINRDPAIADSMRTSVFKAIVDKRVNQGFTVYQSNFRDGIVDGFFGKNIDLMHRNEDNSFLPNLEVFKNNVDKKMFYIADKGLYHVVGYAWGFDLEPNGKDRYIQFAKYVAARYGALPVAWSLAGELPGYMGNLQKTAADWEEVAKVGYKYSGYKNLMSAHLACDRPFPVIYKDSEWFSFAMSQAGHGDFDMGPEMYTEFVENYKGHPVLESEATYEGATSNEYVSRIIGADMMRRLAYLMLQTGGCGYTYGCNGVWELQIEAGVGGIGWGDMAWWDGLFLPGADQLTIMKDFYESVNWSTLKPLGKELAVTKSFFMEASPRTSIFFTGNTDMTTIVGYAQPTAMRSFELNGLTAAKYNMYEMNPENGERTLVEAEIVPENGKWCYEAKNMFGNKADAVILIQAV